jgi:hypothetical protein
VYHLPSLSWFHPLFSFLLYYSITQSTTWVKRESEKQAKVEADVPAPATLLPDVRPCFSEDENGAIYDVSCSEGTHHQQQQVEASESASEVEVLDVEVEVESVPVEAVADEADEAVEAGGADEAVEADEAGGAGAVEADEAVEAVEAGGAGAGEL